MTHATVRIGLGIASVSLISCLAACTNATSLTTCGDTPRSSGPAASLATLTLAAPAGGRSGASINPQATLAVSSTLDDLSTPAFVEIVRNGKTVGAYRGDAGGTGLAAKPGGAMNVPTEALLLSGCPRGAIDHAHPDATRKPLPTGRYELIATITTANYGEPPGLIASAPIPFRITG